MSVDIMLVYWLALATISFFGASYTGQVWREVRGLRGMALTVLQASIGVIASLMAMIVSDQALIPALYAGIGIRTVVWIMVLAMLVLADFYAADHNDHRSLTTRSYLWFKSLSKERRA